MSDKEEVITKIKAYVNKSFGGDYKKAFDKYAKNTGKLIGRA